MARWNARETTAGSMKVASPRYDYRNQMVEYEDDEYPGQPHQYIYDLFGRRLWSSVYSPEARVATVHVYCGNTRGAANWQVAREQSGNGVIAECRSRFNRCCVASTG